MIKRGILLILLYTLRNSAIAQSVEFNEAFPVAPDSDAWSFSIQSVYQGYVIYGITVNSLGNSAPAIVKIDSAGNILRQKSYYRTDYDFIPLYTANELGVVILSGGEIGVVNWENDTSSSFAYWSLYRFDGNGDTIWTKDYQDSAGVAFAQIKISRDKKYVLYGEWYNFVNIYYITNTLLLRKTDSLGNVMWTKTYYADTNHERIPTGMDTCRDGGFILCAYDYDTIINYSKQGCLNGRIMVMKTDSSGNPQWITYITDTLCDVEAYSVKALKNGGYVVCGFWDDSLNWNGEIPYSIKYMAKLNDSGRMVWSNKYGVHNNFEGSVFLNALQELPNRDLIVCGTGLVNDTLGYGGAILKTDSNGNQEWYKLYEKFLPGDADYLTDIQLTNAGGFISSGWTYSSPPYIWVVKTDSLGCDSGFNEVTSVKKVIENIAGVRVYPNPNNGIFTITLSHSELVSGSQTIEIYNVLGEQVYNATLLPQTPVRTGTGGSKEVLSTINLTGQPNGVYLYRVIDKDGGLVGEGKVIIAM